MQKTTSSLCLAMVFAALIGCGSDSGTQAPISPDLDSPSRRSLLDSVCVDQVNTDRASLTLVPLRDWKDSVDCFTRQAELDDAGGVAHSHMGMCSETAQNTCPGWSSDTSLPNQIRTIKSCVAAMWAEGPGSDYSKHGHYINMTQTSYTRVGCGFHQTLDKIWIDMDLR